MAGRRPSRAAVAQLVAADASRIVDELTELLGGRISSLGGDEVELGWLRASIRSNVEVLVQLIAHPADLPYAEPPPAAVSLAQRLAQRDVPFHELVRAYQLAESWWVQMCMRHVATLTDDPAALIAETVAQSDLVHTYVDQVVLRIGNAYEVERVRWRHLQETMRFDQVTALLDGTDEDLPAAEATLGYRLRQTHLAVVAWLGGQENSGDELARLQRTVGAVADVAGCTGRPLAVPRDRTTLWAWLPLPAGAAPDARGPGKPDGGKLDSGKLEAAIGSDGPRVRIALGQAAAGPDGFVTSHRQAAAAHEIGLAAGAAGAAVIPYAEVASLTFLCADLPRARLWVAEVLGPLALDRPREQELRRTLSVYSSLDRSATATARVLNCHKNTVQYRIATVERLLGHRLGGGRLDLELALLAAHWLGSRVLTGP
jgi:DNA-binding PucR family transcriptional regulator